MFLMYECPAVAAFSIFIPCIMHLHVQVCYYYTVSQSQKTLCKVYDINISQRSAVTVATRLRCGGMFSDHLIANLLLSFPVKEL